MDATRKNNESHHSNSHAKPANAKKAPFFSGVQSEKDTFFQPKLTIHPANDAYEVEADRMADQVTQKINQQDTSPVHSQAAPAVQKQADQEETHEDKPLVDDVTLVSKGKTTESGPQRKPAFFEQTIQAKEGKEDPSSGFEKNLNSSKGGGSQMDTSTRSKMESGFGADFSSVRIHTGSEAVQMSQNIGAKAFTHGNNVYFNQGKYQPGTKEGDHLLAHELTHTIQQGGVQRKAFDSGGVSSTVPFEDIQASFIRELIDDLVSLAGRVGINIPEIVDNIPGYTLFSYVVEYDIIRGRGVERNGHTLIRGLMGLIPGGNLLYNKLNELGIIDQAFEWVEGQLSMLNISMSRIESTLEAAWDDMGITLGISGNLRVLRNKFSPLLNDIETFASNAVDELIELVKEALVRPAVEFLEGRSDAVKLAYKVIGRKFPLDDEVNAPTVEILEDFLILIGKETEVEQMKEKGTLQETADWIDTQISRFFGLVGRFQILLGRVWDAFTLDTLSDIPGVFQGLFDEFMTLLQDFFDFALEVAAKVLEFVKKALLEFLNSFAADIPGFTLLTVILGRNPLTDEIVPRSVENIIRGFMGLIPGGESKFQELKQSGVIPRSVGKIEALIAELGISWGFIVQLFTGIWDTLSIEDLVSPIATFQRIADQFGEPISRLFTFVTKVVRIIMELILEIMGIPPDMVANIIANAMSAFEDIKNDPVGFLLNLMNAIKEGFLQFMNNIGTHLMNGLQNWLFGTLADAGIQIPSDLSIESILGMAMEVLGITVDNILDRLALQIGEERVAQIRAALDTLTGIWEFVKDVMDRGAIAIWEYVEGQLSNLWTIIQEGIMGFIQERVITQAITWLLSFLDVTGIMPVIRGVQSVFNAISSFIEKLREILEIVNSFVAGIADIARGNIASAADFLENALADGIPVAISFLAKQLGLGDISEKIQEMIESARGMINEAIDWLIAQAMRVGTAFLGMIGMGSGGDADVEAEEAGPGTQLPPVTVDEDIDIGTEEHELKNSGETDRLVLFSTPTQLDQHPSPEVKAAYATYLREIGEATSATGKREAANRNLTIIVQKIKDFGDPDAPGASAPGIGNVDRHKNQQSRMRNSGIDVWFTESEHVIPRAFVNAAFEALAQAGVPAGRADYRNMHTILIYKGAANAKTQGPFGDQSTINEFKSIIREIVTEVLGNPQVDPSAARGEMAAAITRMLAAFATDAKNRTNLAIIQDNQTNGSKRGPAGTPEPPTPTSSQVDQAFNLQNTDINNQLQSRIDEFINNRT